MNDIPRETLRFLKTFEKLEEGDQVYSKDLGRGGRVVTKFASGEIFVDFSGVKKRFRFGDMELSKVIPPKQVKVKKLEIISDGKEISFKKYKEQRKVERLRERLEEDIAKLEKQRTKGKH